MKEPINSLLKLEIFSDFYTEEIQEISEYISCHSFLAEQVLIKKGERGNYLGIILQGEVNILEDSEVLTIRSRGELLGEMALIQSEPRSATVIAATDGEIALISFDDIETIKQTHPQIAIKLISVLTRSTLEKLQEGQTQNTNKYIVLLANENEYSTMIDFVIEHKDFFQSHQIATTNKLANVLSEEIQLNISKYLDPQRLIGTKTAIGSLIMSEKILGVIYLRAPILAIKNQLNIEAFLMLCDVYKLPLATNVSTAEAILYYLKKDFI